MAVKWETVKAGDVLWDAHRQRMGNTTVSRMENWTVKIVSIDHEAGTALASWNGNTPRAYTRRGVERLRRTPFKPKAVGSF